jgi:glutathione-regulated potassium-efflux system ancillary protein KefG
LEVRVARVLVQFAHPALEKSRVNRLLAARARDVAGITFRDLYEEYPDFDVDVRREQALLLEHDTIVLQHPLYWYSTPALLKQWLDLVLEHGWAYGRSGVALRGKRLMQAITAGGGEAAYREDGHNAHTVRQFLAPMEQTAALCGMEYLPPFVVHGTHRLDEHGIALAAAEFVARLVELRDAVRGSADPSPRATQDAPGATDAR